MTCARIIYAAAIVLLPCQAAAEDIVGIARVVDGDTLAIGTVRVRLWGIDAPEIDSDQGVAAAAAIKGFVGRSVVTCAPKGNDGYGRVVALCRRGDGEDLALLMVRSGHAQDWPYFSGGYYAFSQESKNLNTDGLTPLDNSSFRITHIDWNIINHLEVVVAGADRRVECVASLGEAPIGAAYGYPVAGVVSMSISVPAKYVRHKEVRVACNQ